ncbi:hypothetical protein L1N85_22810 [Paenibacillus alkaliterrae]|uniref:hypothetical protein n=1 Tax=Paenibacillus alkaliterrae TaxID=320909 RepID=UPI001F1ED735|nr:hypothetical protein [Paenibacillus alkaliterrae]MCF2941201.1 hypothetical protein [Paenibacillus alkaliterrae]
MKNRELERLLWCVAFPGFGQFLNRKYFKGIVLLVLEFLINIRSSMNEVIIHSFRGDVEKAIQTTDFEWLMFYPCVYMFAIWDAYKDAGGGTPPLSFLPFVIAAFFGTIGVIYSTDVRIAGFLLGPVWLPLLSFFAGICIGKILQKLIKVEDPDKSSA